MSYDDSIVIRGARVHNLKNVSLTIPRNKLVVFTGPSGSGKSSLAFDLIYAEGQRRYVESLSAYARQFLEQLTKPDADLIEGLSPTISIEQKTTSYNPRSTVGTVTEIYDFLRLIYARVAKPFCYSCGKPIHSQSPQQIVDQILAYPEHAKIAILAPIVRARKGEYQKELSQLRQRGFVRARVDGETIELNQDVSLEKNKKHDIDVYIDRLIIKGDRTLLAPRVSDSVELALKLGNGLLIVQNIHSDGNSTESLLSEKFACPDCGVSYPAPEPRTFSFNSPMGACPQCDGLGYLVTEIETAEDDETRSEIDLSGLSDQELPCPACLGDRLKKESLHYRLAGKSIAEVTRLQISSLIPFFKTLELSDRESKIIGRAVKELLERLVFLQEVGLNYLSLARSAQSLSGGEAQRIRLATQIGSALVGVIYVLDEPSIGLHPRDNSKLIQTLLKLRDLGNTVIVVEHDQDTMEASDYIVDLGPGAGRNGGAVVAEGPLRELLLSKDSLTAQYLRGDLQIAVPESRRPHIIGHEIVIEGAHLHNLKDISVAFPLSNFICVTGVSGSGKSSLVFDTLYRSLLKQLYSVEAVKIPARNIRGLDLVDKVIDINQSPIGKTPRSNPSTYTGLFTHIRDLFSSLPESQTRGYAPGRFSFNVKGGRCEACEGDGMTRIEMHFLPDVFVECDSCKGKRYNRETLEIHYKGKSIADVLALSVSEALAFFASIPPIKQKLQTLDDVGLGYVQLGQSSTTLSGGEAQRIKLARELSRRGTGKTVYLLDEPSTGLHFDDVKKLVQILQTLVDQGNTVILIEHNLDLIKVADRVIELGPEGGEAGGELLMSGTPEQLAANPKSPTGLFLKQLLSKTKRPRHY